MFAFIPGARLKRLSLPLIKQAFIYPWKVLPGRQWVMASRLTNIFMMKAIELLNFWQSSFFLHDALWQRGPATVQKNI